MQYKLSKNEEKIEFYYLLTYCFSYVLCVIKTTRIDYELKVNIKYL